VVFGLSPETTLFHLPLGAGRWLSPNDGAVVVVNDEFLRDEPDIRLGDRSYSKINGRKVTLQVIGIAARRWHRPAFT